MKVSSGKRSVGETCWIWSFDAFSSTHSTGSTHLDEPELWNTLQENVQPIDNLHTFNGNLKTHMYTLYLTDDVITSQLPQIGVDVLSTCPHHSHNASTM